MSKTSNAPRECSRKKSKFSWAPITGAVRDVLETQETLRMKAGMHAILKRRATQDFANIKSKETKTSQLLNEMKEEKRRIELISLNQILKLSAHNLQRCSTADSIKRRTSCATEMIAEAQAAVYRPSLRKISSFKGSQKIDCSGKGINNTRPSTMQDTRTWHSQLGFAKLPVKENAKSLSHLCGFTSFTLLC